MSITRWSFITVGPLDAAAETNARAQVDAVLAGRGLVADPGDLACFAACVAAARSLLAVAPTGPIPRVTVEGGHSSATQPFAAISAAWDTPTGGTVHSWAVEATGTIAASNDPLLAAQLTADLGGVGRAVEAGDTSVLAAAATAARAWLSALATTTTATLSVSATVADGSVDRVSVSVGLSVAAPAPAAPGPLDGVVTPPALIATSHNYNPAGLAGASDLRLSATAAATVTGLAGGSGTRTLRVYNVGTANITLIANSALSTPGNRFLTNGNILLNPNEAATLVYDPVALGWRAVGALL